MSGCESIVLESDKAMPKPNTGRPLLVSSEGFRRRLRSSLTSKWLRCASTKASVGVVLLSSSSWISIVAVHITVVVAVAAVVIADVAAVV